MRHTKQSPIATKAARVATDRGVRLALEHGAVEALEHYALMTEEERRASWLILTRRQARTMTQDPMPSRARRVRAPWWSSTELALCTVLRRAGVTSRWVVIGDDLHQGHRRANGPGRAVEWTWVEDGAITADGRPVDTELAAMLGRSVSAIQSRRRDLMRAAEQAACAPAVSA